MCNSVDRQLMLLRAHNPDFCVRKTKIAEDKEEFPNHIYSLDIKKKNFVDRKPTDVITEQLNRQYFDFVNFKEKFDNFYGFLDKKPVYAKDPENLPVLSKSNEMKNGVKQAITNKIYRELLLNLED